jgi:8-oxo-dGTP pyrophosphatase MutT (NUDIX family)
VIAPSFDEAVDRIRGALAARPPRVLSAPGFRRAAVLAAVLDRPGGPTVLFTRRAETLPHHRGEISFPGGALEPGETPEAAALREAEEEVGLAPGAAELLGRLDEVVSIARFVVTPIAAAVRAPPAAFVADPGEVDEGFELPLAHLLEPSLRRATLWDPGRLPPAVAEALAEAGVALEDVDAATGHLRVWSFHADERRVVWGLTARMLVELLDRAFPRG